MNLADIIAPMSVETFFSTFLSRQHAHFQGARGRFEHLLPWSELNRALAQQDFESPRLRIVDRGVIVDPAEYMRQRGRDSTLPHRVDPQLLAARLRAGATLVLDRADEVFQPITDLAVELERSFGIRIQGNLYASWGTQHGFKVHWDSHDVLVIQIHGRKRWALHGSTRRFPLSRDVDRDLTAPPTPEWEGVLESGDAIHVPRGHWHVATPTDEPSLHVTFGIPQRTGVSLVEWMADQVRGQELFRMDLPRFEGREARRAHAAKLREAILSMWTDDFLDTYFDDENLRSNPRPIFALPWAATANLLPPEDTAPLRLAYGRTATLREVDGQIELRARGQVCRFAPAARPVLEVLLDRGPHTVAELSERSRLAAGVVRGLLRELARIGLVTSGP